MIDVEIPMQVLADSIQLHGMEKKKIIAMEEMSELTKEVCKDLRGELRRYDIVEEFADVFICLNNLKLMYNITDEEIQEWVNYKTERQIKRDWEYARKK